MWSWESTEWQEAATLVNTRRYRLCINQLEALVFKRMFELTKMNMSGTGLYQGGIGLRLGRLTNDDLLETSEPPCNILTLETLEVSASWKEPISAGKLGKESWAAKLGQATEKQRKRGGSAIGASTATGAPLQLMSDPDIKHDSCTQCSWLESVLGRCLDIGKGLGHPLLRFRNLHVLFGGYILPFVAGVFLVEG
ncbi:hypothetical protein B0H11DRAFT_1936497 [Mycena galericulata]|nr:hypothetical protein B0H11DRAFT_1936497 [Mycena galericulata]